MKFVGLHAHALSIGDSIGYPIDHFKFVVENAGNDTALAITDHGTAISFGYMLQAYNELKKKGINFKPIFGCEAYFLPDLDLWRKEKEQIALSKKEIKFDEENDLVVENEADSKDKTKWYNPVNRRHHLVILAQNKTGLKNLNNLISESYINGFYRYPRMDIKMLEKYNEGLIISTACLGGFPSWLILRDKDKGEEVIMNSLMTELKPLLDLFGERAYLELQFNKLPEQKIVNEYLVKLSEKTGYKLIATADSHYARPEWWREREIYKMLAMQTKGFKVDKEQIPKTIDELKCELYPKNGEQMFQAYQLYNPELNEFTIKEAIERTWDIAYNQCDTIVPDGTFKLPIRNKQFTPDHSLSNLCWSLFNEKYNTEYVNNIPKEYEIYKERLIRELDVIEKKGYANYFLVLKDALGEIQKYYLTGCGRGCVHPETLVLTDRGFLFIKDIQNYHKVYDVTGKLCSIKSKFEYEIEEDVLQLNTLYSRNPLILTKDHKLYGVKQEKIYNSNWSKSTIKHTRKYSKLKNEPIWLNADQFEIGDWLFVPTPKREFVFEHNQIDLASMIENNENFTIESNKISYLISNLSDFSIRRIHKLTGISKNCLRFIYKNGKLPDNHKPKPTRHFQAFEKLSKWLKMRFSTIDEWRGSLTKKQISIDRFIITDNSFYEFVGRWIGDGWYKFSKRKNYIGIAFHSNDPSIIWFKKYLQPFCSKVVILKHKTKNLNQLIGYGKILPKLFMSLFPDYQLTSNTKYIGQLKCISNNKLKSLLKGLIASDGHIEKYREQIDSTSKRLIDDIREILFYLGIPSSIQTRKTWKDDKYSYKESYKIRFKGLISDLNQNIHFDNGYYTQITNKQYVSNVHKVYDLQIDGHPSYLTDNCIVHNSGAGSLVCYLLGITKLDPIKHNLLFERFLSENRNEAPDIDNDVEDRDGAFQILKNLFGEDKIVAISNFNTLQLKSLIKDLAKTEGIPYEEVNAVTSVMEKEARSAILDEIGHDQKLYVFDFDGAYKYSPTFKTFIDKQSKSLVESIKILFKQLRVISKHAGGVAIVEDAKSAMPLIKIRGELQTPWTEGLTAKHLEQFGIIKYDFLGLKTLRMIRNCIERILESQGQEVTFEKVAEFYEKKLHPDVIQQGEKEVFENVYHSGKWISIFQFTEKKVQEFCKRAMPNSVADISAITALWRPGPLKGGADKNYIAAIDNPLSVKFEHPILEELLSASKGILIYQEQFMLLAHKLAGFTLTESDELRKLLVKPVQSMGAEMKIKREQAGEKFIKGCIENGLSESYANHLWHEEIMGFISYGFNKSHSDSYAYISYQCAWLLNYYTPQWISAVLEIESMGSAEEKFSIISTIKSFGYNIQFPEINQSKQRWTVVDDKTFNAPLNLIKGIGEKPLAQLVQNAPYKTIEDLLFNENLEYRSVNKRVLDGLCLSGALSSLIDSRFENDAHFHACVVPEKKPTNIKKFTELIESTKGQFQSFTKDEIFNSKLELLGFLDIDLLIPEEIQQKLNDKNVHSISTYDEDEDAFCWFFVQSCEAKMSKKGNAYYLLKVLGAGLDSHEIFLFGSHDDIDGRKNMCAVAEISKSIGPNKWAVYNGAIKWIIKNK